MTRKTKGEGRAPGRRDARISKLGAIPASAKKFLESRGFEELYPPQAAAVEAGLLDGQNLLVSAPTASGKTLVAMLAAISHLARGGGRVVYLSPLRALAAEKYAEFSSLSEIKVSGAGWQGRLRALQRRGGAARADATITTARLIGERGAVAAARGPVKIDDADIVIATNEAMDAVMRRGWQWTQEIGLMIIDEVHLIGDETRGPTLEMILTQQKQQQQQQRQKRHPPPKSSQDAPPAKMQIVGLSATINNDEEIARWLGCTPIRNTWRPVPLAEGVCDEAGSVMMNDGRRFEVGIGTEGMPARLGIHAVSEGGQSLIFAATRASARATAVKASKRIAKLLSDDEKRALGRISSRILPARLRADAAAALRRGRRRDGASTAATTPTAATSPPSTTAITTTPASPPTELEKDLAILVSTGVAFHHAGLSERLRDIVESEFRRGSIKLLASTPTLGAGVNLPARRVVIASVRRYDARYGFNRLISVLEYKQLCGRAGRPQYDKYGEAVISATGPLDELQERYVEGEPEPLESGIMAEKAMRTHLLTVVVLNPGIRQDDLHSFFSGTLGGLQYSGREVEDAVGTAVEFLLEHDMIVSKGQRYAATSLGRRTSSLYVDPVTASYLRNVAEGVPRGGRREQRHTLGFLHAVISCDEFNPRQDLLKNHYHFAESLLSGPHRSELLSPVYAEECSRSLLVLHDWMNERTDREIEAAYKTQSGDLHRMAESAAWLAYVMREMAKDAGRDDLLAELAVMRTRLRSGIKEELVELASIRGVGRVRARAIYDAGLRSIADIRAASPARLATIRQIGPTVAASIMRAVSGKPAAAGYGRRRAPRRHM